MPESINPYPYATDAPTTFTDPSGMVMYTPYEGHHCPALREGSFWQNPLGSIECNFGVGPAGTLTGGGAGGSGGVGPGTGVISPTPAAIIIVAAVSAFWLYSNWDNIWRSPGRVEPTVIPPSADGKVPTTVPAPPDPTLRLPVVQLSKGTPTSPIDVGGGLGNTGRDGLGQGTGWTVGFPNGYARNLGKALRSPSAFKVCVGLTGAIALRLWTYETEETACQNINRDPSDYGDIWGGSALLCYGAAAGVYIVAGSL